MDRLKHLLRSGISSEADLITLKSGAAPVFTKGQQSKSVDNIVIPEAELNQIVGFLLPNEKNRLGSGQPAKGVLKVPGAGRIQVIAVPTKPLTIKLFLPPNGDQLASKEWLDLQKVNKPNIPTGAVPGGFIPPTIGAQPKLGDATGLNAIPPDSPDINPIDVQTRPPKPPAPPPVAAAPSAAPSSDEPIMPPPIKMAAEPARFPEDNSFQGMSDMKISIPGDAPAQAPQVNGQAAAQATLVYDAELPGESASSNGNNAIDAILSDMVKRGASDLHLTNSQPIIMRIDGDIVRLDGPSLTSNSMASLLDPIMPETNRQQLIKTHDTDFAYQLNGVGRFRVNIFRDRNGIGSVMRHIPSEILTAEQLGLKPAILNLCGLSKGLVLVTGPTGSGKSTTLAAMIDLINKQRPEHVLTIEDPIEFVHPQQKCLMNQREIERHTKSFGVALRAALREDPDIVLIGEMRDLETVAIAIETAETGHLVFGTLHTTTAMSTVDRIVDQFPTDQQEQIRIMLASSLKGVISQTLLKKKGGGRVAAHEILIVNDAVAAMIREGKTHMMASHMQTQRRLGNQTLNEALLELVKSNTVGVKDAVLKSIDKNGFAELLKRNGIAIETDDAA